MSLAEFCQNWELHFSNQTFARMLIMLNTSDNTFAASASALIDLEHVSNPTLNGWVPCPYNATAEMAFEEVIGAFARLTEKNNIALVKFKHIDGKEYLSKDKQLAIVKKYFPLAHRED